MLVLSRKEGDSIVIDGGIEITITEIQGSRARIAIKAPRQISIARGELVDAPLVDACRKSPVEQRTRPLPAAECSAIESC